MNREKTGSKYAELINRSKLSRQSWNLITTVSMLLLFYVIVMAASAAGSISYTLKSLLVSICIYAIGAVSLNLCVGYLGELSLGHAGFMSLGAFSSAVFTKATAGTIENGNLRFFLGLLIGIAVAGLFGFLIGIPVLRLNGDYLAIVTLAFGEIVKGILNVTYVGKDNNGLHFALLDSSKMGMSEDGEFLVNGARGVVGTAGLSNFTVGMILLLLALLVSSFLVNSRTGRAGSAIRDNVIAAESVGISVTKYKLTIFTISAAIAGSAGVLYAHFLSSMTASKFDFNMSILLLVFIVLGGIGSFKGAIIAAALLTALPEVLRGMSDYRMLIYAILLITMMLFKWSPKAIEWRDHFLSDRSSRYRAKKKFRKEV